MECVYTSVVALRPFIDAVLEEDWAQAQICQQHVARLEGDADEIKKKIRLQLPSSLFMPVSRSDLLELLRGQDQIANRAKDIAGLILGRKMSIPLNGETFKGFLDRCINVCEQARKAINELDELVETGFRGREAALVQKMIFKLDNMEKETDDIQVTVRAELFSKEAQINPINVMFLYKVLDLIGDIADSAQKVGHSLLLLIAK